MGLWDFVKNAGKALGIGDAKAAEAPPAPEALKQGGRGPRPEDRRARQVTVDGDTVKVSGKARDPGGEGEADPRRRQRRRRRQGRGGDRDPRAGDATPVFHTVVKGDTLWKISEKTLGKRRALPGDLRGEPPDARPTPTRSTRARCCASPPSSAAAGLRAGRPRYRRAQAPGRRRPREDAWRGSRRSRTSEAVEAGDALGRARSPPARSTSSCRRPPSRFPDRPAIAFQLRSGPARQGGHPDLGRDPRRGHARRQPVPPPRHRARTTPSPTCCRTRIETAGGAARRRDRRRRRPGQPAALGRAHRRDPARVPAPGSW